MKLNTYRTQILIGLALAGLVVQAYQLLPRHTQQAYGKKTQQIVEHSEELYHKLAPFSAESFRLSTFQGVTYSPHGEPLHDLLVQIASDKDPVSVVLDWNVDTGELVSVRHGGIELAGQEYPVMESKDAVEMSASWLRKLGLRDVSSTWKLSGRPKHIALVTGKRRQGTYAMHWSAPDREVEMTVQDRTGDLMRMDIRRMDKTY